MGKKRTKIIPKGPVYALAAKLDSVVTIPRNLVYELADRLASVVIDEKSFRSLNGDYLETLKKPVRKRG